MHLLSRIIASVALIFLCVGCRETAVLYDISQPQVQEVVAALHESGIASSVEKAEGGASGKFSVLVPDEKFAEAHAVLRSKGLPRPHEPSLAELVEPNGLLPQPRKLELLRYDRALALEVKALLIQLPEVVSAEVVVRTAGDETADQGPSISAVVQALSTDSELTARLSQIITKAVPNIAPDRLGLEVSKVSLETLKGERALLRYGGEKLVPFLWFSRVPEDEYTPLAIILSICFFGVALAGGVVGFWWRIVHLSRETSSATVGEAVSKGGGRTKIGKKRLVEIEDAGS